MLQLNYKLKQKQDKQETTLITRTGHMAQWLRTVSTLKEGPSSLPSTRIQCPFLAFVATPLIQHMDTCARARAHTHTHTHTQNLKIIFKYKEQNSILMRFEENFEFGVSNFKVVWLKRINCVDKNKKICPLRYA